VVPLPNGTQKQRLRREIAHLISAVFTPMVLNPRANWGTALEFEAQLKSDHPWAAVATESHTQEASG
jgi:hypothetical protein